MLTREILNKICSIFVFLFIVGSVDAQVLHHINHTAGTATYGNTNVTLSHTGNLQTSMACYGGPYWIARSVPNSTNDYKFTFSAPTNHVRAIISGSNTGEVFRFKINNQDYFLNIAEVSNSGSSICNCGPDTVFHISSQGYLDHSGFYAPNQLGCIRVDIQRPGISSFEILHPGGGAGSEITPYFLEDTTAFIKQPFIDTVFCPGDKFPLVYTTNFNFKAGNIFTAQLSNSTGSFSSPVNIGTEVNTVGDTVWCTIPQTATAGTNYRLRILGSNPVKTSLDNQVNIRIKAAPLNFSNTSNSPVCTGDTVRLLGSTTTGSGVTWAWAGPGSFTSMAEDSFIANAAFSHAGNYILTATLTATGCSLKDTVAVVVNQTPAKPNASSNAPVCETKTLTLSTSSSTGGVTYSWAGPGSYSNNTQNPTVTTNATSTHAGNYINTATLGSCSSKDTVTVTVLPKPQRPTASAPNSPLCARQQLQLSASAVTASTYHWYGPSAYTSTGQNTVRPYIQFADAGRYYVYVSLNGCISDTDSVAVVVNTDPVVNIFPTPGATICQGQTAVFTAIPTNGGTAPTYQWRVNGINTGATGLNFASAAINNNDKVSCHMTSTGTCATAFTDTSNEITMTVQQKLTPGVTMTADAGPSLYPNQPITFTAVPTNGGATPTYQWLRNGAPVGGATSAVWGANANFLSDNDDICVLMKSNYACPSPDTAISNCMKLDIRLNVAEIDNSKNIRVYPNPATDKLQLTIDDLQLTKDGLQLTVYNALGQSVINKAARLNNGTTTVDVSALAAGVYMLKVSGDGEVHMVRFVKE